MNFKRLFILITLSLLASCNKDDTPDPISESDPVYKPFDLEGRILFVKNVVAYQNGNLNLEEGRGGIYYIDDSGLHLIKKDSIFNAPQHPCWSPDGSRIAYIPGYIDNSDTNYLPKIILGDSISIINLEGVWLSTVISGVGLYGCDAPDWSPDGTRFAFGHQPSLFFNGISLINVDGTNLTQLMLDGGTYDDPAWSPDGNKIVFAHEYWIDLASLSMVGTVNTDGTMFDTLTTSPSYGSAANPEWSPNGGKIVYEDWPDIMIINSDGTNEYILVDDGIYPTWSPDGTEIAFYKRAFNENSGIYVINVDGTNERLIYKDEHLADLDWN